MRLPANIEPESVDEGDTIRVVFQEHQGIRKELTGQVYRRGDAGQFRTLYTAEGGELLTWKRPHTDGSFRVVLLAKAEQPMEQLPIFDALESRYS